MSLWIQYVIGENKLTESFGLCENSGGFYFCDLIDIPKWLSLHRCIIINNLLSFKDFIKKHIYCVFIDDQTDIICFEAIKQNGIAFKYIKVQTIDLIYPVFASVTSIC